MLNDVATAWLRKYCPNPQLQRDFLQRLGQAEQQDVDCYWVIGPKNVTTGTTQLVHCYAGELFVFSLTPEQGNSLGAVDGKMTSTFGNKRQHVNPALTGSVTLEKLEIDNRHLKVNEPIRGRCRYQMSGYFSEPWCLRLETELHGKANVTHWFTPFGEMLRPEGTIEFTFSPMSHKGTNDKSVWQGTAAAFLRFCTMPNPSTIEGRVPFSNTAAALLDVVDSSPPSSNASQPIVADR